MLKSGYLPTPTSDPVIRPSSGSITTNPRSLRIETFALVAGFSHISGCIAGTRIFGAFEASTILVSKSSALPEASFANKSAVAGAIKIKSFSFAIEICGTDSTLDHRSVITLRPESASQVALPTKFKLAAVGTTSTMKP